MTFVAGFGFSVPERVVSNAELAAEFDVTEEWIVSATGIRERRAVAEGETVVDLAEKAARAALVSAGLGAADLGGVLVGTGSSPRRFPGVSADLQRRLGVARGPAFDVPLASVGGLFAFATAVDLAPRHGPFLVVGAEAMSTVMAAPPRVKETAILFGDGAGACVVLPEPSRGKVGKPALDVVDVSIASDGAFADDLALDLAGPLRMNGRAVILQANRKLTSAVGEIVARNGLSVSDVDLFLFHQANRNLLRQVGQTLKLDEARVFVNLDRYGNTSSASLFIALAESAASGLLGRARHVVLAAFGAGFSWGAALLTRRP